MSYSRKYTNVCLKYTLPSRMFHPSVILERYLKSISHKYDVSPEEVIDMYVEIYLQDLEKNVTKMIRHDGNIVFNSKENKCIIDESMKEKLELDRIMNDLFQESKHD